jgi:hypothetical protein
MKGMRLAAPAIVMIALGIAGSTAAYCQDDTDERVLADLLREAARASAVQVHAGATALLFVPEEGHPMPLQIFAEEFSARNIGLVGRTAQARSRTTVDVRAMNSSTVPLANSSYLRTVRLSLGVVIEDVQTGSVAWSKSFDLQRTDTLAGAPAYELRDFREGEDDSWVDSVLLPVLTAAAALVVVVLLFTVRGS